MKNVEDVYRLTPAQRELLLPPSPVPEAPLEHLVADVRGPLDEALLEEALRELVRRHTALRTAFFLQGMPEPMQVVREKLSPALERADAPQGLESWLEADRKRGMGLTSAPLVRLSVVRTAPEASFLVFAWHAAALDAGAARLCLEELLRLYQAARGKGDAGLEKARPFREYLAWMEAQGSGDAEAHLREALKDPRPTLLAVRSEAGPVTVSGLQQLLLPATESGNVLAFLRKHKLGLGTLLQAAWALMLRHHTGNAEVVFGAQVPGRTATLVQGRPLVGRFAHLLPRRLSIPAQGTPLRWLRALQAELSEAQRHEHASLSQVRQWLKLPDDVPLFQSAVLAWEPPEEDTLKPLARGLGLGSFRHVSAPPSVPLTVEAVAGERLALRLHHDANRFAPLDVIRLVGQLAALLDVIATQPDRELSSLGEVLDSAGGTARSPATASTSVGPEELRALLAWHPEVRAVDVRVEGSRLVAHVVPTRRRARKLDFGLFFFADEDAGTTDKYRLLLEAAKFGDAHGFSSVSTPERHFHEHGGIYPNPSLLAAGLATMTKHIGLRAGSVVLPLQSPFRVAEEWSIVDNLSGGRAGISIASGWVPNDFALNPEAFTRKRDVMWENLEKVERLWRGESVPARDGVGKEVDLKVFPRPIQPRLPTWVTCATDPALFERTGTGGYNVLTSLLGQPLEEALEKIGLYHAAADKAGHARDQRTATLMMHTFVGQDVDDVLDTVRAPLTAYLRAHVALMQTMVKSLDLQVDINEPKWADYLASYAFERYYRSGALIGTVTSCLPMVDKLLAGDVDEVACLIDFGVGTDAVLQSLTHLAELKRLVQDESLRMERVLTEYLAERLPGARPALSVRLTDSLSAEHPGPTL
ncbi:LLM class flavin-dependent oxidoreductase [Corallococcus praedator]|uniref:LLM class flavin-dependent oxidoreductase n=1 Tax=Corallococcus praedator TaxID=2316724 RepID=A0ABX9QPV4_9BACT|nr:MULTISPECIES: MupA/Atu3671 family FMN-dependent luciferase-like monooxygenase [Corallococcus]RKH34973.1 LLM class flavin-dependent oxidoreductase [Corallococcus sp. CA031C]RKI15444.1 LLM class flavin-dependent oxidoreductase [Corallococcus praedator]